MVCGFEERFCNEFGLDMRLWLCGEVEEGEDEIKSVSGVVEGR
jgi:hypothetical protein